MRRAIISILTWLLLALGVALAGLWVRSYLAWDRLEWHRLSDRPDGDRQRRWLRLDLSAGSIDTTYWSESHIKPEAFAFLQERVTPWMWKRKEGVNTMPTRYRWVRAIGIYAERESTATTLHLRLILPLWLLVGLTAVLPVMRFRRYRRWRRAERWRANNQCPQCGYDLRATPERCPECGTAVGCPQPKDEG